MDRRMPCTEPAPRGIDGPATDGHARFAMNAAANLAYFILNTGLMIWYVPFLIGHLGTATYGIVPLANSLVLYAGLISEGLNASIYRYLAIDLGRGDTAGARRTFNGAAALTLATCTVLLIPAAAVAWLFPALFRVPPGSEQEARFLFASVSVTMIAALVGGLFGASSQITHRFDLRNGVRAAVLVVRVGLVVLCFAIWPASLWHVGFGLLAAAGLGLGCDILIWRYLTPQLAFRPQDAEAAAVRAFVGLSGWSTVNMLGFLLLTQVDLMIVNGTFGPEMTGRYGSILLFPALITAIAEILVPMLSPEIMASYAADDTAGIERLTTRAVRLLGLGLALPAGLLCGLGAPLLALWLGPDFAGLDLVLALLCGHLAINLALRPLAYVLTAYNKVRGQGLVSIAAGGLNILLALLLARWFGWGVAGVAAAVAVVWTAKNALFLSLYSARVLRLRWWTFIQPLAPGLAALLGVVLMGRVLADLLAPTSWPSLAVAAGCVTAAYCAVAYAGLLTTSDRRLLRGLVPRKSYA